MKWATGILALSGFAIVCGAAAGLSNAGAADEQTIRKLDDQALRANDSGDAKTLDQIEADDFTLFAESQPITKQQQLDLVRARTKNPPPGQVDRRIEDFHVRFYGLAALVTQRDVAWGSGGSSEYRTTTVWERRGADWKLVHMHFSKIAEH